MSGDEDMKKKRDTLVLTTEWKVSMVDDEIESNRDFLEENPDIDPQEWKDFQAFGQDLERWREALLSVDPLPQSSLDVQWRLHIIENEIDLEELILADEEHPLEKDHAEYLRENLARLRSWRKELKQRLRGEKRGDEHGI